MTDLTSTAWITGCAALLILLIAGLALVHTGSSRAKNAATASAQLLLVLAVASVAHWAVGQALAWGPSAGGWFGNSGFAPEAASPDLLWRSLVAGVAACWVCGALLERTRLSVLLCFAAAFSALIAPVLAHWSQHPQGWLRALGLVDGSGAVALHAAAGWSALAGALAIGPRLGRLDAQQTLRRADGHHQPMLVIGGLLVWAGWFGLQGGQALLLAPVDMSRLLLNTHLSACAAALVAAALLARRSDVPRPRAIVQGALAGLVAASAGAATGSPLSAIVTGAVAAVLCRWVAERIRRAGLDDACDVAAIHGVGATWGLIAAGLFYRDDLFNGARVLAQLLGAGAAFAWALVLGYGLFKLMERLLGSLRYDSRQEMVGLDEHSQQVLAYPEFHDSPARVKAQA